jgi:hypothetical protein
LPPIIQKTMNLLAADEDAFEAAIGVLIELVSHPQSRHFETSICDGLLSQLTLGWFRERFNRAYQGLYWLLYCTVNHL